MPGPRMLSPMLLCLQSDHHFCVALSLYPNNASAGFATDFSTGLRIPVELVVLKLIWKSSELFQPQMSAHCINLLNGCLFSGWCSLCSNSHLSAHNTQSQFAFVSDLSVLLLMVFPSPCSNRLILSWKWIFKCCFIDFGLMSPWCFTPSTRVFCRLFFKD